MSRRLKIGVVSASLAAVLYIAAGGLGVHASSDERAYRQLGVFSEVLNRIRTEYVEEPNFEAVRNGSLHGLLESLDANSSYLSPAEYKRYRDRKGDFKAGVGATISKRAGFAAVVAIVPAGPADKAGIQAGDIIEAIEGQSTRDISLAEIRNMMGGEKGSNISLTLLRPRKAEPERVTVTRDEVKLPAPVEKMLENNIGYLKPGYLIKGKAQDIAAKIKQVTAQGAKRLILDLRGNSEGDYSEGVAIANLFLDHGNITSLKGQTYAREDFNADASRALATKLPLVILVNRGTAGPAEIVAAAILENNRGDVLGDKTFGIGSVQKLIEVNDGSALILSIAKYYSPGGKAIQDNAVTPNIVVADADDSEPSDDEDDANANPNDFKKEQQQRADEQLQRAINVLKSKQS